MTIFGRRDRWAIEVEPLANPPEESDPAAAATWCAIKIWVDSKNLTAHTRASNLTTAEALHWPAAYLARWFLRAWDGLWERAGWPLAGPVVDAQVACARLDAQLAELGEDADDELLDRRDAFVQTHTLLAASGGGVMPPVYLMREGEVVHVTWGSPRHRETEVTFLSGRGRAETEVDAFLEAAIGFLTWCRDAVAPTVPVLATEIDAWLSHVDSPVAAEAALRGYIRPWAAPASSEALVELDAALDLPLGWRESNARLNPSRFPAAVVFRAVAPVLALSDVQTLLGHLRAAEAHPEAAAKLNALRAPLALPSREPPHQQGYALAEQLRSARQNPDRLLDIEALIADLGIPTEEADLSDAAIDAATVWDDARGPVILLNTRSPRQVQWAWRMTLAHELCHLLVDRAGAAPLMVASTPWAPPDLERRANAFAAELLLPKAGLLRVAGAALQRGFVDETARHELMDEFQVGITVCTHQIENRLRISCE